VRLRIDELLRKRGLTVYALAKASKGRISLPMAYRLVRRRGRFTTIKSDVLDALCEVFEVGINELFDSGPRG
jgi:DNA-binding Xre family transcriptional regulator